MIVLHEASRTIGRMVRTNRNEIELSPADTSELMRFGVWKFSDDHQVYPRSELRHFLTRDAALAALRKLELDQ